MEADPVLDVAVEADPVLDVSVEADPVEAVLDVVMPKEAVLDVVLPKEAVLDVVLPKEAVLDVMRQTEAVDVAPAPVLDEVVQTEAIPAVEEVHKPKQTEALGRAVGRPNDSEAKRTKSMIDILGVDLTVHDNSRTKKKKNKLSGKKKK